MTRSVVASFWVYRPKQFPKAPPYCDMLQILERSCRRFGFEHVVLTDVRTAPIVSAAGMTPWMVELPDSLMRSQTEVHARWLASPYSAGVDTFFMGADCLIRRDFRADLPACDLAIAYMKGNKRWRLNNGFVYIPAASRDRVAPLFRLVADDTGDRVCEDMIALERALVPMPPDYGVHRRRDLDVAFLPIDRWNRGHKIDLKDAAEDANVMHFMGGWRALPNGEIVTDPNNKSMMFAWSKMHGFA